MPKGFEKFLKKTKKGINHEESNKKEEKKAKEQPDDEDSDAEEPGFKKEEPKNEKSYYDSAKEKAEEFKNKWLMQPGGGGPRWGILIGLLGVSYIGWMTWYGGEPSQEIGYMDFINNFLQQGQVKMITITEERGSSNFKFRAVIELDDGSKKHVTLPQVENFLHKIDLVQREMGKDVSQFVPLKYASGEGDNDGRNMNLLIAAGFGGLLFWLYRAKHGKGGSSGKPGDKGKGGGGGFGGGGGMGDMMGMSKSGATVFGVDKKIRTRFKHVAGMENAKQEVLEFVDFLKAPEKY